MKQVDLGPNDYKIRDPKTGRWHLPDDPKLARNYLVVLIVVMGFVFINRDAFSTGVLFGLSSLFAFSAGIMLAIWKKNKYY